MWLAIGLAAALVVSVAVSLVAVIRHYSQQRQALNALWKAFARDAGLRYRRTPKGRRARGVVDGLEVRLYTQTEQIGDSSVTWTRAAAESRAIPRSLILRTEGAGAGLRRVFTGDDEQTGDAEFDDVARIDGHPADVAALLDGDLRRLLRGRLAHGLLTVRKGRVVVSGDQRKAYQPNLRGIYRTCARVARALELDPTQRAARLARNAASDVEADVRLNCLKLLAEHHPDAPELLPALQTGLADPEPAVRLFAATRLGHESRGEHAREVAQWLAEGGDIGELATALAVVGEEGGREDVEWLRPLTRGTFRRRAVKQAAADAVARIQQRLGGEQGGLALSDEAEATGRLSEPSSAAAAGALSRAREPRGS